MNAIPRSQQCRQIGLLHIDHPLFQPGIPGLENAAHPKGYRYNFALFILEGADDLLAYIEVQFFSELVTHDDLVLLAGEIIAGNEFLF